MTEGFKTYVVPQEKKTPENLAGEFLSMLRTGEVVHGIGHIPPSEEQRMNIEALLSGAGASIVDENMENANAGLLLDLLKYGQMKPGSDEQKSLKAVLAAEIRTLY